jgi:catechol 2,3-dioxygenase-like lactoylglutathione lyase family enzyme
VSDQGHLRVPLLFMLPAMIDHMTFRVADLGRTRAFYGPVLATLGYTEGHAGEHDGQHMVGYVHDGKFDTWFIAGPSPWNGPAVTSGCHLCWKAPSRAAVDAFHAAALAAGGRDNGAPGLRPHYHAHYYGAFVIDPDGNNIEAVCQDPA